MRATVKLIFLTGVLYFGGVTGASGGALVNGQFSVKGSIKPVACKVVFAAGGEFDYEVIDSRAVAASTSKAYVTTHSKKQPFSIDCGSATRVSVKFVDGQSSTVNSVLNPERFSRGECFGLGKTSKGENFGYHRFTLVDESLKVFNEKDGVVDGVKYGVSDDGKSGWGGERDGGSSYVSQKLYYTPLDKNNVPVSFKKFQGAINNTISIDKNLKIGDQEDFFGLVTMELNYI